MKKKALALAVAGAFFAPASYAAQDTSGMQYTSAAEGFYASIRAQFSTEKKTDGGAGIGNSSSRFGVRGSNDLGNGMKGFYQYEAGVSIDNGGGLSTRVGQVGLEGAFGRVWAGSGWVETHNMTYGATDIGNFGGGNLSYTDLRPGRDNDVIQYRTPDISGFQGALGFNMQSTVDNNDSVDDPASDDNDVEMWTAAAKYSVQGFTGAFAYSVRPDTRHDLNDQSDRRHTLDGNHMRQNPAVISTTAADQRSVFETRTMVNGAVRVNHWKVSKKDDLTAWSARLGYAQDNWSVNGWYGKNNTGDFASGYYEDATFFSMAGKVSVGKVDLYAVWEKSEAPTKRVSRVDETNDYEYERDARDNEVTNTVVGISYQLGSRSKIWMDYVAQDDETKTNEEDFVNIGLRHDF
jgi:predicted porin